ncbi:MAG: ribosome biogenesis GTP-binding protein YsxC [Bdellovibrionales bacterium GWA2_49_15]|nr:MAG: ribosome biogenesis GTP-binding protein YsxC [Bdellovibrionales bacterium GWA2_49_15]
MAGRSNVGKSSLINTILGREIARVSKTPGRTRDINLFEFKLRGDKTVINEANIQANSKFLLIDLPGYGHAEVSKAEGARWSDLLAQLFDILPPTMLILNIQDARHPMQESDRIFLKFFKNRPLAASLIFNKYDKLTTQSERARLNNFLPQILKESKLFRKMYLVSAESGQGIPELHEELVNFLLKYTTSR